jgi:hypothetical protein
MPASPETIDLWEKVREPSAQTALRLPPRASARDRAKRDTWPQKAALSPTSSAGREPDQSSWRREGSLSLLTEERLAAKSA